MNNHLRYRNSFNGYFFLFSLLLIFLLSASPVSAHGPNGHGKEKFTALQAAKKGIKLYDQLIASGKLEEDWETHLKNIDVFPRQNGKEREFVVKFNRSSGDPRSVYIFFTEKGIYNGSNFTGK